MKRKDRALIAAYFDGDKFRITRNGEVHAFGVMPNSNRTGWYLAGFAEHILDRIACEDAGRSYS